MTPSDILHLIDQISQDLDMTVYKLESPAPEEISGLLKEREMLRRELERYRERLEDISQKLL